MLEYLDPEIAGEGVSAEDWSAPVPEARIPDYKGIKKIAKYFPQFTGRPYVHQVFPCWLYHPTEPPRLVQDVYTREDPPRLLKKASDAAKELGCLYRATTMEERGQGFPNHRWEYTGEWRAMPFEGNKHKPSIDAGKHLVTSKEPAMSAAELVPSLVAAVLAAMGRTGAATAAEAPLPAAVDPDWAEFQAFKAWRAGESLVASLPQENALSNTLSVDDEWTLWKQEAEAKGIKVDGRWSLERLKAEVEKAA